MSPEYDALRQIRSQHVPVVKTDIGSVLKAARLKKGLALEAVARQTRISKRYLDALEGDKFDEFPALVYLRGFLKGYCEFLETDFEPLWAQVEAATAPAAPAAPAADASGAAPAPAPAAPAAPAPAPKPVTPAPEPAKPAPKLKPLPPPPPAAVHDEPAAKHAPAPAAHAPSHGGHAHAAPSSGHDEPHHSGAAAGAAGAIAFSLVAAAGLGWWILSHRAAPAPVAPPEPPKALQPLAAAVEPTVVVKLKDDAWLRVTLDGQTVFEGRAPRGSSQEWKPLKTLSLRSTSPEALAVELNGQPRELGAAGPDGEFRIDVQ